MACLQIVNEANIFEALLLGGVDSNNKSVRDIWRLTIKFESESFNSVNISYYCIKEEALLSVDDRFYNNHFICD